MIQFSVPPTIQYLWGHDGPYNDYARFIKKTFGQRVQKICLDGGFTCPNRDGTLGIGGCSYCNGISFVPSYLSPSNQESNQDQVQSPSVEGVLHQFTKGLEFFSKKYPQSGFAAYFQSYSASYGAMDYLEQLYEPLLIHPQVQLVIIATRPDLITQEFCGLLGKLQVLFKKPIFIELGVESVYDQTLQKINRHHTLDNTRKALSLLEKAKIPVFAHIIFGLPGETKEQYLGYLDFFHENPVTGLKIHHLQVLSKTQLSLDYTEVHLWEPQEYLEFLCEFLSKLSPKLVVDRLINEAPLAQVLAPRWGSGARGIKNYQFVELLRKAMVDQGLYQGVAY